VVGIVLRGEKKVARGWEQKKMYFGGRRRNGCKDMEASNRVLHGVKGNQTAFAPKDEDALKEMVLWGEITIIAGRDGCVCFGKGRKLGWVKRTANDLPGKWGSSYERRQISSKKQKKRE